MRSTSLRSLLAALACAALGHAFAATPPTRLAWLGADGVVVKRGEPASAALPPVPLGSVWKLFVYGYLASTGTQESPYRCGAAERAADDEYCCDPGGSVERDAALAQSCGPYFEPRRLGISAAQWSRFWERNDAPPWLLKLGALRPETLVPVPDLLVALRQIPAPARTAARQALQPNSLRDEAVLTALGSGPRFKTWSWFEGGARAGGAAGWLADGTPFWFGAAGTSRGALPAHAAWIAQQWQAAGMAAPQPDAASVAAQPCVDVDFFQRYPVRTVSAAGSTRPAPPGPLRGAYRIAFANGTSLPVEAVPAQVLRYTAEGPRITARLPLEDYVARVVDREGDARETAAARALAVAARSYVLQNAAETGGCRAIADDSRTQRVGPNPPSAAARAAAAFTEGLVVDGAAVRYHRDTASAGVMSWQAAVADSRAGTPFAAILRKAWPGGTPGFARGESDCAPLPTARDWLEDRQQRWRQVLRPLPGYQPLPGTLQVCQLAMGTPHSDQRRLLIRIREWTSREGRVTLIHEYLHLAFRDHPSGQDETFIETLAQRLADS